MDLLKNFEKVRRSQLIGSAAANPRTGHGQLKGTPEDPREVHCI